MPTYTVKLGEIYLTSDAPISQEDRKRAIEHLKRHPVEAVMDPCVIVRTVKDDAGR